MKARSLPALNLQILDEASAWFVDFRVGDVDAAARERFDQWLRRSPEHIRAYMEIARTYADLPAVTSDHGIDIRALIDSVRTEADVVAYDFGVSRAKTGDSTAHDSSDWPGRSKVTGRRRAWLQSGALAGCLAVACVAATILTWLWLHRYPTYATEIGENRSVALADGSTIDLNARTRIRIRFSKSERHVDLIEGQALFEVARDPTRPFLVRSDGTVVRAVGTQFDVDQKSRGTTVTVVEGRVSVGRERPAPSFPAPADATADVTDAHRAPREPAVTYVSAGEQVTVTPQAITPPARANVAAATAWTQHRLIFETTRLSDVVDDFNRYNARPLVIDDDVLNDFHVSGVYTSTDPTSLIRFLREQPGVQIVETEAAVHITRR